MKGPAHLLIIKSPSLLEVMITIKCQTAHVDKLCQEQGNKILWEGAKEGRAGRSSVLRSSSLQWDKKECYNMDSI